MGCFACLSVLSVGRYCWSCWVTWRAGPLWLNYVVGLNFFFAQRGCWDGVVRRGRAVRVTVAAMQFIKSQKERPRRYVTISRSPVLISDGARGGFRWALRIALDRSRILADSGLAYLRFAGGYAVLERGNRCLSLHRLQREGRIRRSWRLRGLVGKCPQSNHGPCKNPHFPKQASPWEARAPNRCPASCSSLLAINFTGYP